MKLITAIIKPFKLDDVQRALKAAGVTRHDRAARSRASAASAATPRCTGAHEYPVDFVPKVRIEILARRRRRRCAISRRHRRRPRRTDKIGDGKLWVVTVDEALRLRTGERGIDAL